MPQLVLGPMLRHAAPGEATVWVETDVPCEVEVLGRRARTFRAGAAHYAVVPLTGLDLGREHPYEVRLDGVLRWPMPGLGLPPSAIPRAPEPSRLRLVVASCRVVAPQVPPWTLPPERSRRGRGPDALVGLARRLAEPGAERPDLMLLLGDQVYVDLGAPETRRFVRARRDTSRRPGAVPLDLAEHARLYREAWTEPRVRWLLSTVPSVMLPDDHDVHDAWNASADWRRRMLARPWWPGRLAAALSAIWLYQHLGNLSPAELAEDPLLARVRAASDGAPVLADAMAPALDGPVPWLGVARELGPARLVVPDVRGRRVLAPGRRSMLDEAGWSWLERGLRGDVEHVLLGTQVPAALPPGLHDLEAWSEAVTGGAWGRPAARLAERVRRRLSLEHWPAFGDSSARLAGLVEATAAGRRGRAPASVLVLAGEVHHGSVARLALPESSGVRSAVWQVVSSPLRNPLGPDPRRRIRVGHTRWFAAAARLAARAAGVPPAPMRWEGFVGPLFANHVALLDLDGPGARVAFLLAEERAGEPVLVEGPTMRLA